MIYQRKKYPDGFIYPEVTDFSNPVIIERINTYEDLFFIKSLKSICDYNNIENVELVIPCMPQQQHDRRFETNLSFELKLVGDFINSCNFKKVSIFHPHSDVTEAVISNCNIIDNSKFILKVLADINSPNLTLLSTDGGSYKWINKLANKINFEGEVYGASKARQSSADKTKHSLVQLIDRKDFEGKDVLVIDDLCVFGGTFLGLADMLRRRNVGRLYLAISHITVPKPNKELENLYDKIYCTNSKYDSYDLKNLSIFDWQS
jgi:ribose-phosphate pyrophosphokinase